MLLKFSNSGGVIGIPTDTVYGVAANALDEEAVDRVFNSEGKGRHEPNSGSGRSSGGPATSTAGKCQTKPVALAEAFWPGQLTIVVKKSDIIPLVVSGGLDTVGLRVADHPVPRELVSALGSSYHGYVRQHQWDGRAVLRDVCLEPARLQPRHGVRRR